jgi:hypothetical protein
LTWFAKSRRRPVVGRGLVLILLIWSAALRAERPAWRVGVAKACARWLGTADPSSAARVRRVSDEVRRRLGFVPRVVITKVRTHGELTRLEVRALNAAGGIVGETSAIQHWPWHFEMGLTTIAPSARNARVSELLFASLLDAYPRVRRVSAWMSVDNKARIDALLAAGHSCREAVLQSFAARAFARAGFTRLLVEPRCDDRDPPRLVLGRDY